MDLWCNEPHLREDQQNEETMTSTIHPEYIAAAADHVLMSDHRVLDKLLMTESRGMISEADIIYDSLDSEIRPKMRKILASWMLEVCEELQCELIFPSAMNYLDRFLCKTKVSKNQLQLVGSVCLLVASKLRQCKSIHPEDLVFLSDFAFSVNDMTEWEMLLLTTLKWDVSVVVATDFIDHLLSRLHLQQSHNSLEMDQVKRSSIGFSLLCSREIDFLNERPSTVATACVAASLEPHLLQQSLEGKKKVDSFSVRLQEITGISSQDLDRCLYKLSCLIDQENTPSVLSIQSSHSANNTSCKHNNKSFSSSKLQAGFSSQPETPTDVQDVIF